MAETATVGPAPADAAPPFQDDESHDPNRAPSAALILGCLGVVYGDIGTSPLYALRESLLHAHEHHMAETAVIGIVSMLFWTVVLIVTVKYVLLILRADNRGEGGTLSLVAKAQEALGRRPPWLYILGIVGVALFFGDCMITPAISVLSAVEGLTLVAPGFDPDTAPAALMHNLKHNRVLHERNVVVKVDVSTRPRVADDGRLRVEQISAHFWRVWLRFGYMEQPNVPRALAEAKAQGLRFDIMSTSYFLNRRSLRVGKARLMPLWAARLYAGLYRSSSEPTNFYRLPSNRVVELGQQINI